MEKKKVELLAPAGNYESFLGAIHAGADAVYLGGEKFGARAYADNFSEEEICRAIRYAHLFDRKVYLTVNTLIKDEEFSELVPYLTPFYLAGLDGVIVQDTGALLQIKEAFPDLALHISTQMTVTGAYAAAFLKEQGAVRVVPARELSLTEIQNIKEETGLELETFIHGAMCYCYSGQCLFSSILGGRSGNRGRCAQPCRLPYQIVKNGKAGKEQYPLSLKDMCTISCLPKLIESGIDSFKIEGRMKKPEYAAGVTALYRKYIDLYEKKGADGYHVSAEDLKLLYSLYIRSEIQDGYYFKHNGADMITLTSPAYNGSDDAVLLKIRQTYIDTPLKKEISMYAEFKLGECASLTLSTDSVSVTVYGEKCDRANKQPVTEENMRSGLLKLGNTDFIAKPEDVQIALDEGLFYPLKAVNELRRKGIEALEEAYLEQFGKRELWEAAEQALLLAKNQQAEAQESEKTKSAPKHPLRISVNTMEQLNALLSAKLSFQTLYLESELLMANPNLIAECRTKLKEAGIESSIFVSLPYILRKKDIPGLEKLYEQLKEADGCLFRNWEAYAFLKKQGYTGKLFADANLYGFNSRSAEFLLKQADGFTLPYELNRKEAEQLLDGLDVTRAEQPVYGRIPLMVSANCVAKTSGACVKGKNAKDVVALKDRYQKDFPVSLHCDYCYNIIYNAMPLSLHERVREKKLRTPMRLSFTTETGRETGVVLAFFKETLSGNKVQSPYEEYTLGHEKRGVL